MVFTSRLLLKTSQVHLPIDLLGIFGTLKAVCPRFRGKSTNNLVGRPLETLSLISCATQRQKFIAMHCKSPGKERDRLFVRPFEPRCGVGKDQTYTFKCQ